LLWYSGSFLPEYCYLFEDFLKLGFDLNIHANPCVPFDSFSSICAALIESIAPSFETGLAEKIGREMANFYLPLYFFVRLAVHSSTVQYSTVQFG